MDDTYTADMDCETLNRDFDDIDLFGERMVGDDMIDNECNINFE